MAGASTQTHIGRRLQQHFSELGPQERRVADFILAHLEDLAVYSAADLSRLSGVSKATVTRLFRRLGYDDFKAVKAHARQLRHYGVPLASGADSLGDGIERFRRHAEREQDNLRQCLERLTPVLFDEVVGALDEAPALAVIGYRNSYPIALHLRQQLLQARSAVQLLPSPNQSLAEELVELDPQALIVLIGFRRRPRLFETLIETLARREQRVLLIGDPTTAKYDDRVTWRLECSLETLSAFDSYASAMSLVSLLANAMLHRRLAQGRARIGEVMELYQELEELAP
ncbi:MULTISPECIES: MurR/RpiR family transcriptional regulator [Halomonadaceae]|uniref:MurR/RpiR family transcriptional regulator n=1 Tax=Halomonadaceae TaxID=28256 RepID=UPI001584286A|nr:MULTISPECIES: MurR/RpiR family transcriptional regulator [Halomonas]MDI4636464.1 MurR/RpiR family transcriptional regulator [Halomonas sp. BMC7]NUJ60829.1 MurR/RpiR family transcriptional regulator [Halomonas taeanensis]